jgi:hypothetical protein
MLGFELIADAACLMYVDILHHELHTAVFTRLILLRAMLSEQSPLVIAALVNVLVKETHYEWFFPSNFERLRSRAPRRFRFCRSAGGYRGP